MICNVGLIGCGNVGTALLELLSAKREFLRERFGLEFRVCLVAGRSKGTTIVPDGLDLDAITGALARCGNFLSLPQTDSPIEELIASSNMDILAEATPSNLTNGEPAVGHIRCALFNGASVATTNKGAIYCAFDELARIASDNRLSLRYEGVVMSGTPVIRLAQDALAGCEFSRVEGILNGTTNYMLCRMEDGLEYSEALAEAQSLGYAETDPSGDVEGHDAAVKVAILLKVLFDKGVPLASIHRDGITNVTRRDIERAASSGRRIKLVACIEQSAAGLAGSVQLRELPTTHRLAGISGATNAISIETDNLGTVSLIGAGAGRRETAQALLADIIKIAVNKNSRV